MILCKWDLVVNRPMKVMNVCDCEDSLVRMESESSINGPTQNLVKEYNKSQSKITLTTLKI